MTRQRIIFMFAFACMSLFLVSSLKLNSNKSAQSGELLVNGNFEQDERNRGYATYLPGWTIIGLSSIYLGNGIDFNPIWPSSSTGPLNLSLQLDVAGFNNGIRQDLFLQGGKPLDLYIGFAAKQLVPLESTQAIVRFNGVDVIRLSPSNYDYQKVTLNLVSNEGLNFIEILSEGTPDGNGLLIDYVDLRYGNNSTNNSAFDIGRSSSNITNANHEVKNDVSVEVNVDNQPGADGKNKNQVKVVVNVGKDPARVYTNY